MKQIVYVASPESQQIHVWQLDETGALALLQTVDVPGQGQPMAIHPDKTHLYIGVRPEFAVVSYRIEADGKLEKAGMAPLPKAGGPTHISTDLQGRYLFSVTYGGNCAGINRIDHHGVVTELLQEIDGLHAPHSANIDPTNQLLLVPCLKEDRIRLFDLSLDGKLKPHSQEAVETAKGSGPRHMAFHHNDKFAYCVNELDGTVDVLAIKEGKYTLVQTVDIMPAGYSEERWAADIHLTPNGHFMYVSDRKTSILTVLKVSEDGGSLTVVDRHNTEAQPRGFNIDHSGRYVISAGQASDHIVVHQIDQNSGKLTDLARYPVGKGPMWVSILAK